MSRVKPLVTPDLYHLSEDNSHKFYKIPKELCDNRCYRVNLTSDAKLIYALLLDRMELSRKNGWVNKNNEIYLLFTKGNISNVLGISETTVYKSFKQLELFGLVKQVRQGLNKPNMIYIGKVKPVFIRNCVICSSGSTENECQDKLNMKGNETDRSETDLNETEIMGSLSGDETSVISFLEFTKRFRFDENIKKSIDYYLQVYKRYKREEHPNLKVEQWTKVVNEWLYIDLESYEDTDIDTGLTLPTVKTGGFLVHRYTPKCYY